jgi:hypothetical protein
MKTAILLSLSCLGLLSLVSPGCSADSSQTASSEDTASQEANASKFKHQLSSLFFRGGVNRWGKTAMVLVADNTWQLDQDLLDYRDFPFKLDVKGDWTQSYGDNENDGVAELGGSEIRPSQCSPGRYRIRFNDKTLSYTVDQLKFAGAYDAISLLGVNTYPSMGLVADHTWAALAVFEGYAATNDMLFDVTKGSTRSQLGDTNHDGKAEPSKTAKINVGAVGVYKVTLNDKTGAYTIENTTGPFATSLPSLFVRGTFNNWATQPMKLVGDGTWAAQITFSQDTGHLKFDVAGDWKQNFGLQTQNVPSTSTMGQLVADGKDILVATRGQYVISFYEQEKQFTIRKQAGWVGSLDSAVVKGIADSSSSVVPPHCEHESSRRSCMGSYRYLPSWSLP